MMNLPSVLKLIVAVFFLSTLPAQVNALTPAQVFDKVKDSVVVVKTLDAQGKVKGQGSGVLLPSGKIATNCHVVEGGASYQVGRGKQLVPATYSRKTGTRTSVSSMPRVLKGNQCSSARRRASRWGTRFMPWVRRGAWNFPFPTASLRSSGADRHP